MRDLSQDIEEATEAPEEEDRSSPLEPNVSEQMLSRIFWDEALGTYVLALDGEKRPSRVRTSNAGHALMTGIALPSRAARVLADLMQPSSFSGWGVRTVATNRGALQPDELPQRLGLAARQRDDRRRRQSE